MRKIREVLRLKFELKLDNRQIAASCKISHVTVGNYLARVAAAGLSWPLPEEMDDGQIQHRLFGGAELLRSQALMRLVGFNGREVREGTSARGKNKTSDDSSDTQSYGPSGIRGPLCAESIATYIAAISASALETFFNGVIRILAAQGMFPKRVYALLDASEIESTQKCEGCGKVRKEKAPELRLRAGRIRKVVETVFGFKILVVWDPQSKLPLAMRFSTINVQDIQRAKEVVQQAMDNLKGYATIATLAFDRSFLMGPFLWWLDRCRVIFYVGIRKFREQIRQENGNKLIVFDGDRYAIFDTYEVFILCNRNVLQPRGVPERITKDDILRKYGADRE